MMECDSCARLRKRLSILEAQLEDLKASHANATAFAMRLYKSNNVLTEAIGKSTISGIKQDNTDVVHKEAWYNKGVVKGGE